MPMLSPTKAVKFFSHVQMTLSGPQELRIKFLLISAKMYLLSHGSLVKFPLTGKGET